MQVEIIPLKVLIIEDFDDDAKLLCTMLKRAGYTFSVEIIETPEELKLLLEQSWDIIFCDYSMPKMNGLEALDIVRSINLDVPFIFVSGTIGEDIAVETMRRGAQDYIMKDNLRRLIPAVRRELAEYGERMERRRAEERLRYLAHFDDLTGLRNRYSFLKKLNETIENCKPEHFVALLYFDLDRFKTINDSLGFEAGNILLKKVAKRVTNLFSERSITARIATDEFAIAIEMVTSELEAENFAKLILYAMQIPIDVYDFSIFYNVSIGISLYPRDASSALELLTNANVATGRSKEAGGKTYRLYSSDMGVHLEDRLSLERNMREALIKNEFFLLYQPQFSFDTGIICGVEALVRWRHSFRGIVSPAEFIPIAEESGFIVPLGEWVLHTACQQLQTWRSKYAEEFRLAVNISARQFHHDNLVEIVSGKLAEFSLPAKALELEITESTYIRDVEGANAILEKFRRMGIAIALDDFGTGYSSLSYLRSFKADYLKIDQSFIRELPINQDDSAIVSAIIAMSEKLSLKTIAEGVETLAQYDFLKAQGCNIVQGYYTGRPMPAEEITVLLAQQKNRLALISGNS